MIKLCNVHIFNKGVFDILVEGEKIASLSNNGPLNNAASLLFDDDAIAFPGIINSHDHLHFNLFPQLGNKIYTDYVEWGTDIHAVNKNEIAAVLKVPEHLRTQWGMYKNLLNGVTTVVHHDKKIAIDDKFIDVFQDIIFSHSVKNEKNWKQKLNNPFTTKLPYVVHIGEGTNGLAYKEITQLLQWNLLHKKLIGIHGVAMDSKQAKGFKALIWCPVSNFFLLNATATIDKLKQQTSILFGTDSTLSADWNMWQQLRLARKLNLLSDEELYQSVTTTAAAVWQMPLKATLAEGHYADILITKKKKGSEGYDSFFEVDPEDILLVMQKGEIRLIDEKYFLQLAGSYQNNFSKISINNSIKYIYGNLPLLINEIKKYYPSINLPIEVSSY